MAVSSGEQFIADSSLVL